MFNVTKFIKSSTGENRHSILKLIIFILLLYLYKKVIVKLCWNKHFKIINILPCMLLFFSGVVAKMAGVENGMPGNNK